MLMQKTLGPTSTCIAVLRWGRKCAGVMPGDLGLWEPARGGKCSSGGRRSSGSAHPQCSPSAGLPWACTPSDSTYVMLTLRSLYSVVRSTRISLIRTALASTAEQVHCTAWSGLLQGVRRAWHGRQDRCMRLTWGPEGSTRGQRARGSRCCPHPQSARGPPPHCQEQSPGRCHLCRKRAP